jgi:thiol-disulfide isomerase/thioredoxin
VEPKVNFLLAVLGGVIIISVAMSMRSCASRPPVPPYFERGLTLEAAVDRGKREELVVLAFFTAEWCPHCTSLKEGALSSSSVQKWVEDYAIPVYVDVSKARRGDMESKVLMTRYQVTEFPTILLLENGAEVKRASGNIPRRELMKWLRAYSEPPEDGR